MTYEDSWGGILNRHLQFRCKICADGTGGSADMVGGDAWQGDDEGYPTFSEADGRSLIISRTSKGEETVRAAEAGGFLEIQSMDIADIDRLHTYQARRKALILSRLAALSLFGRPYPRYHGLNLVRSALKMGPAANIRSFFGLVRRILFPVDPNK